jgi:hypothetical protein
MACVLGVKMPIPQNAGSAWSFHWEPADGHEVDPKEAKPPYITVMCFEKASLTKSRFNDAYYVREDSGNLWFLGSFERDAEACKAFITWTKCH